MWRRRTHRATSRGVVFRVFAGGPLAPHKIIRTSLAPVSVALVAILATSGGVSVAEPKRDVPDYDGRGNQDADAGSWALWIPRLLLSPLYVANEYLLRRPLGAFVSHAERDRWRDTVARWFSFGEGGRNLIVPTARFELDRLPSVGLLYSRDDAFATGNVLAFHVATWGPRWFTASVVDRYALGASDGVHVRTAYRRAEDNLFVGIGPDGTSATASRYGLERIEGSIGYRRRLARESRLDAESGIRRTRFVEGDCCGDPSLDLRIAADEVMAPPGYRETYAAAYARIDLTLDTRRPRPEPGGGVFLYANAAPSFDLAGGRSWVRYGGVLGGAVDVTGQRRTLAAQLTLDFVDPLAGDAIPFTEYAELDGDVMPGFATGWLIGRSGAAAQLAYTWPVWLGLDARTRLSIGNAFDAHLDGLSARNLRMSGDVGFTTSTNRDHGLEILFGLGTETFAQGGEITSVRLMLGSRRSL
jgi:hypothetical protein